MLYCYLFVMDSITFASSSYSLVAGVLLVILIIFLKKKKSKRRVTLALPPGPPGWPIIGNIFQLGDNPHQSLFFLAQKYGPLMTIKLGMQTTLVVSSPSMAREVLKNNDQSFSSRTINTVTRVFSYQGTSLLWSPYGPQWRLLRKTCNTEIFSAKRLDALQHLRRDEVFRSIDSILENCKQENGVQIGERAFMISLTIMGKMIFGKKLFETGSAQAAEFKSMVRQALQLAGLPNLSDFFPFLGRFDLQGLNSKANSLAQRFDNMFDRIIEERLAQRADIPLNSHSMKDFLDVMLDLREDGTQLTLENIKALLMDVFIAGIDTTSATIEWTMTELLRKPALMKKSQEELDDVVGVKRRMEEADIANLPYLRAVVKEVFRLHPLAPLIIRRADMSCEISGFFIPENTHVLVNAWAIGRDPSVWKDPLNFNPDRFLESNIDYKGQDFELLPFGAGRRICLGLPLAHRLIHLVVGSLLQAFTWSIPMGNEAGIDMSETFGITLQRTVPLRAIPSPRNVSKSYC
ncbi:geraniol 8-hydroxylase [Cryptomeria japonica]|uniref:geraniol 8-hydroxylase n=1 Tax=Cryptomeria japonica TaxID=3369 RepID=UPI0027D9F472|nr:geraniol 8-hydroxylase [Cryptomeria japonica]